VDLSLTTRSDGDTTVVEVAGEIDVYTAPQLRTCFIDAIDSGARDVVADMTDVTFLDSTGLGILVGARRRAVDAGGDLRLIITHSAVLKIFRITGLDKVFSIEVALDKAVTPAA